MNHRMRSFLLVSATFVFALAAASSPPQHPKSAGAAVAPRATPTQPPGDATTWKEIDRLVEQQKLAEASAKAEEILRRAIAS
jgi:hypothetical protein